MTTDERQLQAWLAQGPDRLPQGVLERALAETRGVTQVGPGLLGRVSRPIAIGRARNGYAAVLVAGLLIATLIAALAWAGSQRHDPLPSAGTVNGLLAYEFKGTIYVANADGHAPREIGTGSGPAFSPDGTRLAYFSHEAGQDPSLVVVNVDGSQPTTIVSGDGIHDWFYEPPAWSSDGRTIAFTSDARAERAPDVEPQVYTVSADGSAAPRAITSERGAHWSAAFSPDGQWLAFAHESGTWRIEGAGTEGAALVEDPADPVYVSLIVTRLDGSETRVLYRQRNPSRAYFGHDLAWSSDSTRIAYSRMVPLVDDELAAQAVIANLDGSERVLARGPFEPFAPLGWSSDGRWFAFERVESGELTIYDEETYAKVARRSLRDGMCRALWAPDAGGVLSSCERWTELLPIAGIESQPGCPGCDPADPIALVLPVGARVVDWQRLAP